MRAVVSAPVAAAVSGANRASHREPLIGLPARASEMTRAAATGVPNSAPSVAASARVPHRTAGMAGRAFEPSQNARPMLAAMIGFSGPRLGPPASISAVATSSPGSTYGGSGSLSSPTVAGSGPA